jgi:hypothetical protein
VPLSGQTQAAKRTAQTEAVKNRNKSILKNMCKEILFLREFALCKVIQQWLAFW